MERKYLLRDELSRLLKKRDRKEGGKRKPGGKEGERKMKIGDEGKRERVHGFYNIKLNARRKVSAHKFILTRIPCFSIAKRGLHKPVTQSVKGSRAPSL